VYDKGFSIATDPTLEKEYQLMISYRSGDMHAPQLEAREGLAVEVENVIRAVNGKEALVSDGIAGGAWCGSRGCAAIDSTGVAVPVSGPPPYCIVDREWSSEERDGLLRRIALDVKLGGTSVSTRSSICTVARSGTKRRSDVRGDPKGAKIGRAARSRAIRSFAKA